MPATPSPHRHPAPQITGDDGSSVSLEQRWNALQTKADQVAVLAELQPEEPGPSKSAFEQCLSNADEGAAKIASRGLEDMELLAETGLRALTQVKARGKSVQVPALALWRELYHARGAVLSVLEPVPT